MYLYNVFVFFSFTMSFLSNVISASVLFAVLFYLIFTVNILFPPPFLLFSLDIISFLLFFFSYSRILSDIFFCLSFVCLSTPSFYHKSSYYILSLSCSIQHFFISHFPFPFHLFYLGVLLSIHSTQLKGHFTLDLQEAGHPNVNFGS